MDNIILIGFMGAGKSTVGRELAKRMGRPFLDTDPYIEERAGMKISRIFAELGEERFREMETEALQSLLADERKRVIACGGGLPLREENRRLLKQLGTVFWLQVSAETVEQRLGGDSTRPLLAGPDPETKIRRLLEARRGEYRAASDRTLCVERKSPGEICREILRLL